MTEPRRYAEGTTVDVTVSQMEIKKLLTAHGASQFMIAEGTNDKGQLLGVLQFRMNERMVKYVREYPSASAYKYDHNNNLRKDSAVASKREGEWRRRWRALQMIIKAKLEMMAAGDTTFENEFMAYIMLPDGRTVGDVMLPQLAASYETGIMPSLLPENT